MSNAATVEPAPAEGWAAKIPLHEILVGISLCVAACLSIYFTRVPGGIALFWPGSVIAAALLMRMARVRWVSAVLAMACAMLLANVAVAHRSAALAGWFTAINGLEIGLMVAAFGKLWRFPYPNISIPQASLMTLVMGVLIPAITAALGASVLHVMLDKPWTATWLLWWSSHTIGACLLGPPILLFSVKGLKRLGRGRYLFENAATLLACCAGCYLTVRYVRFPFVSMSLMLLMAAFRVGGFGASLLSLSFGLLITNLWLFGIRPIGLDPHTMTGGTLIGLPVLALLATVMPPVAVGLGSDARRAAARALRVSERRFRESMAHSPIGMLISGLDGRWSYSNLALQKMLGYTAEEFRAMPAGGPSKADDWQDSGSRWRRLIAGEIDSYDVQRCFLHKEGHWVWAHVSVSMMRDEDGTPLHLIAQMESLEARRQAEQTLVAERERLRITLEAIGDAVITTDAGGRITYVNAAAQTLLGLSGAEVVNRRVDEVIHLVDPDTSRAAANLIAQSSHRGDVCRREQPCLLHRSDGSIRYVLDVVTPVIDSNGTLGGLVIVFHDASLDIERGRDLQHRALHDPLTGLSNRADFSNRLRDAFKKAMHLGHPTAVIAIDLDRFKSVNDTAGHAAGDAVLCKVAAACRDAVRSSDTVARLGGDEFAVILENCSEQRIQQIAEHLLKALNPVEIEWLGKNYSVNASLGLAVTSGEHHGEIAWLDAADQACLLAKRAGRSQMRYAAKLAPTGEA